MRVLIGCEESQAVCKEFRRLGHEAYSCDIQPCSGGRPEWHLQMDVFKAITLQNWDMGIFFPDCTYLTVSANTWFKEQPKRKSGALVGKEREQARDKALQFVCDLLNCGIPKIAIENPVGVIGTRVFKHIDGLFKVFPTNTIGFSPTQIIQPYYFGDNAKKTTCLWLINLHPLNHVKTPNLFNPEPTHVDAGEFWEFKSRKGINKKFSKWYVDALILNPKDRAKARSKTFPGIAKAMAEQWGQTP